MAEVTRTFIKGVMNQDLDERILPDGIYRSATNITVESYAAGNIGAVQNAYGNSLKADISQVINTATITDATVIGAVAYEPKRLIYWLVTANEFDAVIEYNIQSGQTTRVLQCSKPNPGSPLNFSKNYIVTGINYIEGQDGNNYLFWTDNYNPPRRININRCKGYTANDPSIANDISVIMAPPLNAPYISISQDNNPDSTNLKEKFVYFSYRYKYIDNEYSSMSPFSAVGFEAGTFAIDYETGDNLGMINQKNKIDIHFETGNEFVQEIQLLVRDTRSLNVMIIDSFNKNELNIQDNTTYSFTFRNNKILTTLTNDQVTRLFDNVPLKALAQDIIGNRLIYGNYLQFRNITDSNNVDININFTVSYVQQQITDNNPKRSFRSDRDYEVGIVYTDEYGRMTTVLTPALSNAINQLSNAVYIPPSASDTANSLQVEIKHNPPSWATNYRLVLKQNRREYYNIFPRLYVCDGLFRYFLINESDRDKFAVGDYIILKKGASGVTHSNKQYKILEFELKQVNFIGSAPEGLYFKIKIDYSDVSFFQCNNSQIYTTTNEGHNQGGVGSCSAYIKTLNNINNGYGEGGYINKPVFYGLNSSVGSSLKTYNPGLVFPGVSFPALATGPFYWGQQDLRYTIEIKPGNKFNYTVDLFGISNWISPVDIPIVTNTLYSIKLPNNVQGLNAFFSGQAINSAFFISFSSNSFSVGDKWKISCRAEGYNGIPPTNPNVGNIKGISYFNSSPDQLGVSDIIRGGVSVVTGDFSGPIYAGAQIKIQIIEDSGNGNLYSTTQTFTSNQIYENIEEWFVESGSFNNFKQNDLNGNNRKSQNIWFRNVKKSSTGQIVYIANPYNTQNTNFAIEDKTSNNIAMFLKGYGQSAGNQGQPNVTKVLFKISQTSPSNSIIFETIPLDTESEIFHELSRTFPIKNGKHISRWFFDKRSNGPSSSTRLTQLTKEWPHYFTSGEKIYLNTNGVSSTTQYTIIGTPSRYSIDVTPAISVSPSYPGSVSYTTYEQDQTSVTNGAKIQINYPDYPNGDYNSFAYNTALETYRIKDAYNAPTMDYSLRVTAIVDNYEEEYKFASLTYSGVFQATTSINKLNEFNLSLANFKNLDKRYGSVQKLKARDTDLLTLHQDKITSVLYGKNLLYDAVGGSQVASIPEVLGNQVAYPGEFGISNNPESFATWGDACYFTDQKRGSVVKLIGEQVLPISTQGMGAFWIDTMRDNPNNFKFGGIDPYNGFYVVSISDRVKESCSLNINPSIKNVSSSVSQGPVFMFSIDSMSPSWTISIVDNGYGTSWVNCQTLSGSYSQFIYASYAANPSNNSRSVIFRVNYCGTFVKDFLLTQGATNSPHIIIPMVNG